MNKGKFKISKYNFETKEVEYFDDIKAAAASIESKLETWKVELTLAYAIATGKKAFKHGWRKVFEK